MRPSILFCLTLALASLAGCAAAEQIARDAAAGAAISTRAATWNTDTADLRGRTGTFAYDCPRNPSRAAGTVWGSGPYTDDSSVCAAGVHAGTISFETGGRVRVQPRQGQSQYDGSRRNGVETLDYASWEGSFAVVN